MILRFLFSSSAIQAIDGYSKTGVERFWYCLFVDRIFGFFIFFYEYCRNIKTKWNHHWFMYVLQFCLNCHILKNQISNLFFFHQKVEIFKRKGDLKRAMSLLIFMRHIRNDV